MRLELKDIKHAILSVSTGDGLTEEVKTYHLEFLAPLQLLMGRVKLTALNIPDQPLVESPPDDIKVVSPNDLDMVSPEKRRLLQ